MSESSSQPPTVIHHRNRVLDLHTKGRDTEIALEAKLEKLHVVSDVITSHLHGVGTDDPKRDGYEAVKSLIDYRISSLTPQPKDPTQNYTPDAGPSDTDPFTHINLETWDKEVDKLLAKFPKTDDKDTVSSRVTHFVETHSGLAIDLDHHKLMMLDPLNNFIKLGSGQLLDMSKQVPDPDDKRSGAVNKRREKIEAINSCITRYLSKKYEHADEITHTGLPTKLTEIGIEDISELGTYADLEKRFTSALTELKEKTLTRKIFNDFVNHFGNLAIKIEEFHDPFARRKTELKTGATTFSS